MKLNRIIIIISLITMTLIAQENTYPPPTRIVTIPTAGTLARGSYSLEMDIQRKGGMILSLTTGLTNRFQFGLSYGAANLVGDDTIRWYPRPEANLKYLLIDETSKSPGIALGINTQGYGSFTDSTGRYDQKAYGAYLAASKNWRTFLGNFGFHAGMNLNFTETDDGDKDPNLFAGFDLELNPELTLLAEYSAALNENEKTAKEMSLTKSGYLNAGIRWTFVDKLHLEVNFKNLLFDKEKIQSFNREFKITYIEYF